MGLCQVAGGKVTSGKEQAAMVKMCSDKITHPRYSAGRGGGQYGQENHRKMDDFGADFYGIPWKPMGIPWNSVELLGIHWNPLEFNGMP